MNNILLSFVFVYAKILKVLMGSIIFMPHCISLWKRTTCSDSFSMHRSVPAPIAIYLTPIHDFLKEMQYHYKLL